jgi:hypothetical protein
MEYNKQDFLLYLMYIAFIDIRARALELNDKVIFHQCDLLHNIPSAISNGFVGEAYEHFIGNIKELGLETWLTQRETEFLERQLIWKNEK